MRNTVSGVSVCFMFCSHVNLHFDQWTDLHFYQERRYNYLANKVMHNKVTPKINAQIPYTQYKLHVKWYSLIRIINLVVHYELKKFADHAYKISVYLMRGKERGKEKGIEFIVFLLTIIACDKRKFNTLVIYKYLNTMYL